MKGPSTSATGPFVLPLGVVLLYFEERKPVAAVKGDTLSGIEVAAREHFNCPPDARLKFYMKLNDGVLVEVSPSAWPHVQKTITALWIEAEGTPQICRCSGKSEPLIRVFVTTLTGWTIGIRIGASASVATLKELIYSKKHIPPDVQQLRFRGNEMDDDETLKSYEVDRDSGIILSMKSGTSYADFQGDEVTNNLSTTISLPNFGFIRHAIGD